ncbi:hypothetical protein HW555_014089 [Spodoptera exigua]|uniref:Uncharacterized protein n=1 Tax=Spodoptera exigua TaxID=7107 RepID=A0A835L1U5_SPOEX|nr:hypothetical protein HW555_014089 [Spodoptera exigua]
MIHVYFMKRCCRVHEQGARWGRPRAVFQSAVYGSPRRVHRGDRGGKDRGLLLNPRSMGIVARFLSHGAGWRRAVYPAPEAPAASGGPNTLPKRAAASPWGSDVCNTHRKKVMIMPNNDDVLSCGPVDARRSQVPGPASDKLVTEGSAGVGDQAPVADNVTGNEKLSSARKRPRNPALVGGGSLDVSSEEEGLLAPKLPTARRGRQARGASVSRPRRDAQGRFVRSNTPAASEAESDMGVTTEDPGGESCASLGSSKAELNATRREQRKAVAADEVSEMARRARERRAALAAEGEPSAVALSQLALDGVDLVLKVATKSGSLKGTFTRGLKEAAADIKEAVGTLLNRTASDEVAKLQEENGRLRNDLEDLRRQVAALSEQQQRRTSTDAAPVVAPAPAPRPAGARTDDEVERIVRLCLLQCGSMMNARIEAISRRLLRKSSVRL